MPDSIRPLASAIVIVCVLVTAVLGAWLRHRTHAETGWVDASVDGRMQAGLYEHRLLLAVLVWPGAPVPVAAMAAALVLACVRCRRYHEAVFVAVSVPVAAAITEWLLKPLVDRTHWGGLAFPSGHVTSVAALATVVTVLLAGAPARVPRVLRLGLASIAFLIAAAVACGVIGADMHYFTDTVGGAAVGIGAVLLVARVLDLLSRTWHLHDRQLPTVMTQEGDSLQPSRPSGGGDSTIWDR